MELQNPNAVDIGGNVFLRNGKWQLFGNPRKGSALYEAGINTADEFISIAGTKLQQNTNVREILAQFKPGDTIEVVTTRWNEERKHTLALQQDKTWNMVHDAKANKKTKEKRKQWLLGNY